MSRATLLQQVCLLHCVEVKFYCDTLKLHVSPIKSLHHSLMQLHPHLPCIMSTNYHRPLLAVQALVSSAQYLALNLPYCLHEVHYHCLQDRDRAVSPYLTYIPDYLYT